MPANPKLYDSERMAYAYAFTRPPIHAHVCQRIVAHIPPGLVIHRALDVGCGAGASTAVLSGVSRHVVGVDPFPAMLQHAASVAPDAAFSVGRAERLPFAATAFDLATAAGSLNYTDIRLALAEIARVLSRNGMFAPYDFNGGHSIAGDDRLAQRCAELRAQFPSPPGYALNLQTLPYRANDLDLLAYEEFDLSVPMSSAAYLQFILGDAGIETAIANGLSEPDVRAFCEAQFSPVFASGPRKVSFQVQLAIASKV